MRINRSRLEQACETFWTLGATRGGGLTRLALSDEDKRARDQMVVWMQEAGLLVSVDEMGNIFGRRPSRDNHPPVVMGSHVDSVPTGGRYDGQVGVVSALEAVRTLNDDGVVTSRPLEIAVFTNEEGSRFQPAMVGSGVMAGKIPLATAHALADRDGRRLGDELVRIGYRGETPCAPRPIHAYLELHIEQGPVLEESGLDLGIVEGIVGIAWSRITFDGVQDHAGPTPMRSRHDPLVAAADVVRAVRTIPREVSSDMVGTVGSLVVSPNIPNAIPGRVTMSADFRDPEDHNVARALQLLEEAVRDASEREGTVGSVEHYWRVPPTLFDTDIVNACERAARSLGASHKRMFSGAGHDAQYMATICPTGMIFVPSTNGRSHCEEEFTPMDSVEMGANALLLAAVDIAGVDEPARVG